MYPNAVVLQPTMSVAHYKHIVHLEVVSNIITQLDNGKRIRRYFVLGK